MTILIGHKSGGDSHVPVEAPDSLHSVAYAKVLDLICEGEIGGLVDGMRSVYLNETPLQNADDTLNFDGASIEVRTGTQDQDYIAGFPAAENETPIASELRAGAPWTRAFSNLSLSAVRLRLSVPGLQQFQENGDTTGYRIEYAIDLAVDGGPFNEVLAAAFDGKTTSTYERSHRVDLPRATMGWTLRVRRLTENANSSRIVDTTRVESVTEVIDAKLRYPMSALVGVRCDARQFNGNVPARAYDMRLKIIRVPSNYDPVARTYAGPWDGTFKLAWSDNPAWVYYDLVLNDRFGLGHRVKASQLDKWQLYDIGQYCDVMVSDGKGGLEPRFTVNVYIQTRAAAYKVLQDLAAVFRGISYYAAGNVLAVADMPRDPVYTYTAANVIDGKFVRSGSKRSTRYTSANVTWNDPADFYRAKVAHVEDPDGLARYGDRQAEISPFGCTSEGQAQRAGLWLLLTSRLETQGLTWSVGLDGYVAMPGQIVRITDPKRMGRRNAGRIRAATADTITLDKAPTIAVGDALTVILPSCLAETRTVRAVDGDVVSVTQPWSDIPVRDAVWSVDNVDLVAPTYRILAVRDKGAGQFEISATQHEPGKFAAIDSGARISPRPITVIPPSVQPPPATVTISARQVIDQGIATSIMTIAWPPAPSAVSYSVEWQRDNGDWVQVQPVGALSVEVAGIYAGDYLARVRAINALGVRSFPTASVLTRLDGNTSPPPSVAMLTTTPLLMGIGLAWGFPTGPNTIERTELWYSQTPDRDSAIRLGDYAYPQDSHRLMGLAFGKELYFWARLVDRSGNIGPWYPAGDGVRGVSQAEPTEILEGIAGKIGRTELGEEITKQIDDTRAIADQGAWDAAAARVAIEAEKVARIEGDRAIARQVFGVTAGSDDWNAGSRSVFAGARTVMTTIAEGDQAIAQLVQQVQAQVAGQIAGVTRELAATANELGAVARDVGTLAVKVGNTTAAVEQVAQAQVDTDGKLSAMYAVKVGVTVDGKYYQAGIGVGVENTPDGMQTEVYALADRWALLNLTNGVITTPFVVENGQTVIAQALIGDARITNGMIANAAITRAKIEDAAINSAKIEDLAVTTAKIANLAVDEGKIKNLSVSTLKIQDRAVTIPVAYTSPIGTIASDSWSVIASATLNDVIGVSMWVDFDVTLLVRDTMWIEVWFNGTRVDFFTFHPTPWSDPESTPTDEQVARLFSYKRILTSGSNSGYIEIKARTQDFYCNYKDLALLVLGCKK